MANFEKPKIHIYSQDNFIRELLQQRSINYDIVQYHSYTEPKLDFQYSQNLVLIDYIRDSSNVAKLINKFHAICHVIILLHKPNKLNHLQHKHIELLATPVNYQELFKLIDNSPQSIYFISKNLILNTTLKLLVKIKDNDVTEIELTEKELALIKYLLQNKESQNKEDILYKVFGYNNLVNTSTLETHIYRLRQKIGSDIKFIEHMKDGYKLLN
jgi:DNA-binding response OmpR family regulator